VFKHTKSIGQAVSKEFTLERWFWIWSKQLVSILFSTITRKNILDHILPACFQTKTMKIAFFFFCFHLEVLTLLRFLSKFLIRF